MVSCQSLLLPLGELGLPFTPDHPEPGLHMAEGAELIVLPCRRVCPVSEWYKRTQTA